MPGLLTRLSSFLCSCTAQVHAVNTKRHVKCAPCECLSAFGMLELLRDDKDDVTTDAHFVAVRGWGLSFRTPYGWCTAV